MENKNFINQSLWAGSSPNQTGETQSRENRIGVFSYFYRTFVLLFMLLTIGVGQMWADTYYLRYMLNMPSGNYDGNTSLQMTQSSANSNRYYCTLNLTSGTPIGYFIRVNDSENSCWKANATKTKNQCHMLESYGRKHGNSPNRLTFTPTSTGDYIFTYDLSNHHICVSPAEEIIKIAYEKRSGSNDGAYNLGTYVNLKRDGETNNYYIDLDLEAVKYYMFVQVQNDTYYKVARELTEGSSVSLFNYGTNNYGDSSDKINFTPGVAGKYRFTWNHNDKTITYKRLYEITPVAKYTDNGSDYTEGTTGGTVTINGNSSATQVIKDATYEIVATPASGYCVEEIKVGDAVAWSQPTDDSRQTEAKTISTYTATTDANVTVKFAKLQDITLYIHDGGVGGLVLQNYQAKVGEHSVLSSNTTLTAASNGWYYHTFANVTNVSLLNVACANIGLAATVNGGQPIENFTLTQTAYFSAIKPRNMVLYSICDLISVSYSDQAYVKDAAPITLSPTYTLGYSASATYAWTVTSQPDGGDYTLSATNVASPTFSSSVPGTYTLQVQVTSDGCTKSTTFNIEVSSPEITAATFVQNPILTTDHLQVSISYHHIPAAGCYIRLKKKDGGYYNDEANQDFTAISEGSGSLTFTTYITNVPSGVWTVEIWNQDKNELLHSRDVEGSLTVKTGHTITVTAGANGAVSPSTVYAGDGIRSADFTATPNPGYEFVEWTKTAGAENFTLNNASSATTYVTTASSNGTVRADFIGALHTLTLNSAGNGHIISSPEGTARTGETVTITPTPDSGYEFDYIEVNGVSQGSGVTTFTMPGADVTVTAHFKQGPTLGAVTATLNGQQNYGELPIDFELKVTSTYLPNPVVVFLVNDGETTYEVVGAPYGDEGNSPAGTIGDDAAYTTVLKATFTASEAKTYTVSAKLYEGLLLANWDGKDFTGGSGWRGTNGHDLVANPNKQAVNGSNYVRQFKKGDNYWDVDLYRFAGANQGISTFRYAHTRQYRMEVGKTWLKLNDGKDNLQKNDELAANTWQKVVYDNGAGISVDFFYPLLTEGNTFVYFDDIILSNEETMTEKATAAEPASFSINWNYTVTLNNNDATTPGTESVNVTYGSALSNITVPSKTDYTFYGYYTENAGAGTQLIDAAGEWIASVDGYTDENKKWVHDGNVTLYAKWGKNPSLTGLELSTSVVTTGNTFTATPTIDAGDGRTTNVCWAVKNSSDEEVPTTIAPKGEGNAVTITAPAAPGNYKVVATLREGNGCGGTVLNSLQQSFTVEGHYTVTITNGMGSSFVGEVTPATVTANAAEAGMKFDHWTVEGTYTLQGGTSLTSREIQFTASTNISITAVYTDRDSKTVYFAKPSGWTDGLKVYAWEEATKDGGNPSNKNANWPGVECTSTTTEKGTTYYYYTYYIDDNGEGDDKTAQDRWDKIIFNDNGNDSEKTKDLTLVDGHFYHIADGSGGNGRDIATVSGSASAEDWYVCGYWNQSTDDWGFAHPVDLNGSTSGSVVVTVTASCTQEFKIFRASTNEWFKWTGGPNADYYDNYAALIGDPMTLREYLANRNTFTSYATEYRFTLDITNPSNPVLTLTPNDNTPYSATLSKNGNGSLSVGTGAITLHQYIPTTITATPEPGYRFKQWTVSGVGCSSTTSATATFTATDAGGTITAEFTNEGIIYLDKSAISSKWSGTPYVYFYSGEYWNNVSGSGSQTSPSEGVPGTCISASKAMTRIGESQIWYYDYSALLSAGTSKQYIAFVDKSNQTGKNWFDACSVIYRGDFYPGASMFVVRDHTVYKNKHDNVQTAYYNEGYWRKYNDTDPGYVLKIYNGTGGGSTQIGYAKFASEEPGNNTCTAKIHLSSGQKGFKVEGCDTTTINGVSYAGTWYSNSGSMTSTNCSNWEFTTGVSANCGITPTAGGDYIFTLSLADGRLYVSVEYPLANNDYRIVYNGKVKTTGDATHHPSNFIRNISNGGIGKDTVSFFVTGDWSLTLQKCTNASANPVQWANACDAGHTLTASDLGLSGKTGVYVFEIEQNSSGSCSGVTIRNLGEYTGNYYIRTDVADGGWEAYETVPDNKMIFSEYARDHSGFDYYHCHWTPTNTNVKFTIANDYSACITDTVENDTYVTEYGKLPYQASVRFMYNSATNSIGRAYLNGSSEEGVNTFLWLEGAAANGSEPKIFTESGSALTNNIIKMQDKNNWIYQIDIQANEQARVKLISNYRFNSTDHLQYFKGTDGDWSEATTSEIIGGNYASHPKETHALRIIYDFKTNHLLSAWLVPGSGSVPAAAINTNVMIIKQNQEDARQITFSSGNALTEVDTVYTAVLLTKDFLTSGASEYAKQFYWVSFPYTVQINDIFGSVGTYGYDWILQRYNGKKRAANGFWIDSEPNWEFMDKSETLNPYEGYILTLDLSEFTTASNKWGNSVTTLSLYFPSDSIVGNIKQKDVTVEYDQTGYACTITRDNRNIKDSYWRCIGSPSFAEKTIGGWNWHKNTDDTWKTENLPFLYEWNSATNQLSPVAAGGNYTFKPLTGYMVQYSGESLNWTNVVTPSVSAPKRQNSAATDLTYKLQLVRGEEEVDHTFVRFSDDENITAAFEFNQDLCKEFKSGANIYTLTSDQIQVAGNSLPLSTTQTTVVPVGVKIKTAGDYTFSIPEGTEGIGVTLVDNETGVRTSLSALDYAIHLEAGTYDQRFILEISPIQNTPTDIENVQGDNVQCTKVRKVMIDGILYIVKDGKIFDARGTRVE